MSLCLLVIASYITCFLSEIALPWFCITLRNILKFSHIYDYDPELCRLTCNINMETLLGITSIFRFEFKCCHDLFIYFKGTLICVFLRGLTALQIIRFAQGYKFSATF